MNIRLASAFALGFVTAVAVPLDACAQTYPTRTVRVVVPFSAGGAVDGPMRVLAQELGKRWGHQIIVDNRPGAGSTIGSEIVARAPADGYTLLLASQTNAISATLYQKLTFDPVEDFAAISLIGREPGVVIAHPALPAATLQDFIAYAKARPGKVNYASSGNGSGQHLFMAMLASMTGMELTHVPYKGSGQVTTDVIAGVVPISIPGIAGMVGHIKSGKLRALAVTGARRAPQLPDVPTIAESGVPGYEAYVWMGLLAPKGTPAAVIAQIQRDVAIVLDTVEMRAYLATAGMEAVGSSPADFGSYLRAERERWAKIIRDTGARAD